MRFSGRAIAVAAAVVTAACALCGCNGAVTSPDIKPHITAASERHVSAIEGYEEFTMPAFTAPLSDSQMRERIELLYDTVVYDRKKPVFADNDPVEPIYTAARKFLSVYVHDEWTDPEFELNTVHAVHDWLIDVTDYDFSLYESFQNGNTELADNPAFYIDGVLLNGKAVCDGIARTFNFLCAMEGIDSVRVTGSFASVTHAWNKVRIGGQWYNVDVTADSVHYSVGGKDYKQISHGYFLLSDKTIREFKPHAHDFSQTSLVADTDYDYCATDKIVINGKPRDRVIKTQSALNGLFSDIQALDGKIGKIEVRLDFDVKVQVNSADMYSAEIKSAYSVVKNVGFEFNENSKPYFRYPNGVYLFLIYK